MSYKKRRRNYHKIFSIRLSKQNKEKLIQLKSRYRGKSWNYFLKEVIEFLEKNNLFDNNDNENRRR